MSGTSTGQRCQTEARNRILGDMGSDERMMTLRALIAHAVVHDYELWQADVMQAFVHGQLDEPIWGRLPDGSESGFKKRFMARSRALTLVGAGLWRPCRVLATRACLQVWQRTWPEGQGV
jgi:hypothetical protein